MTTITPTRLAMHQRIANAIRRAYLRFRIASAERDAQMHDTYATIEPILAKAARQQAEAWRCELAQL